MAKEQSDYLSYLLRLWRVDEEGSPHGGAEQVVWRALLENPHTRQRQGFASLDELFDFLREQMNKKEAQVPGGCDFVVIRGEKAVTIGDRNPVWETTFRIPGRRRPKQAFLIFNVKHLTCADVPVIINGQEIGVIYHHENWQVFQEHWFTQMINIGSGVLKNGENELQIEAMRLPPDPANDKEYDDFDLKDVICFFQ